ncbi:LPXTG cell wall anchor domain-containing protein [Clostridium botulinum]|uniref:LPXTG cell wall anchor domain-containing protein n=1 Tax=Clostridium botulinum TaxID=1491 RepID=UPI00217DCF4F|nr:LPXTG cell wall anchor domain-containing protein [Clostridium botulinum]MCS6109232.1 LPXTG cell wall anchor domain-containing protein [Clostridium botulinum]
MKKKMRTRKSLTVKKRMFGFFAIAVILLGVIGGFGFTHVIAESNSTTGGGADRSAPVAVVASKATERDGLSGGGSNASVVLNSDNTGTSTGTEAKKVNTDYVPSVNINNMSTYPQTGDAHDTGLIITGFTILIGLFAFYGYKLRKSLKFLQVSK